MERKKFCALSDSVNQLTEKQKRDLFSELFFVIKEKEDALNDLYFSDRSGEVQKFCDENADFKAAITTKRKFLEAFELPAFLPTKNEFIKYMSELYDSLY